MLRARPAVSTKRRRDAADIGGFGYEIAGGSGDGGHDGAFFIQEAIEQTRLAHIGTPHNRQRQPFPHDTPKVVTLDESSKVGADAVKPVRISCHSITATSSSAKSMPASRRAISSSRTCLCGFRRARRSPRVVARPRGLDRASAIRLSREPLPPGSGQCARSGRRAS